MNTRPPRYARRISEETLGGHRVYVVRKAVRAAGGIVWEAEVWTKTKAEADLWIAGRERD